MISKIILSFFLFGSITAKRPKIVFKTNYRLMQFPKGSILQYVRLSFNYHLSLRSLFCLFLVAVLNRFYFMY